MKKRKQLIAGRISAAGRTTPQKSVQPDEAPKKIKKLSAVFRNKLLMVSAIILICSIILVLVSVISAVRFSTSDALISQTDKLSDELNYYSNVTFEMNASYLGENFFENDEAYINKMMGIFGATYWYHTDDQGNVMHTNDSLRVNTNVSSDPDMDRFTELLFGEDREFESNQPILPEEFQSGMWKKFVIAPYNADGYVILKYEPKEYYRALDVVVRSMCNFEVVGTNGKNFIVRQDGSIISPSADIRRNWDYSSPNIDIQKMLAVSAEKSLFSFSLNSTNYYAMYTQADGYYAISMIPRNEVTHSINILMIVVAAMVLLLLTVIFLQINSLIKRMIGNNIETVNQGLAEITSGNLDTEINVRDNVEFNQLSDGINATVSSLKGYIARESERFEQELELARSIQTSAMPNVFPPFPERHDIDIFASMKPAKQVGGDFYDFFFTDNAQLVFLTADVSDKGIPAAMFMMKAKTIIKSLTQSRLSIENVIASANNILCEDNSADMFVTVWIGMLNTETGELSYINAGHCKPLLRRADGQFEYLPGKVDFVVAGEEDVPYHGNHLTLKKGDALFLYTDGVTEAVNKDDELFGEERLKNSLNKQRFESAGSICTAVSTDLSVYSQNAPQTDDITMLAVVYHGGKITETITVDAEIEELDKVFEFIERQFESCGFAPNELAEIGIIADEICSNIVRYAYPDGKGKLTTEISFNPATDEAMLMFIDTGIPFNPLNAPEPVLENAEARKEGGLGIFLVRKFSDRLQYEYTKNQNILKIYKKRSRKI